MLFDKKKQNTTTQTCKNARKICVSFCSQDLKAKTFSLTIILANKTSNNSSVFPVTLSLQPCRNHAGESILQPHVGVPSSATTKNLSKRDFLPLPRPTDDKKRAGAQRREVTPRFQSKYFHLLATSNASQQPRPEASN